LKEVVKLIRAVMLKSLALSIPLQHALLTHHQTISTSPFHPLSNAGHQWSPMTINEQREQQGG